MPQTGGEGTGTGGNSLRGRLRGWVDEWKRLDDLIKDIREWLNTPPGERGEQPEGLSNVDEWAERRTELRQDIMRTVENNPKFADNLQKWGFTYEGFDASDYDPSEGTNTGTQGPQSGTTDTGGGGNNGGGNNDGGNQNSGGGGGGGNGGGGSPGTRAQRQDNRLLGDIGKDFRLVKGPGGTYVAVYTYKINGQTVRVGIKLGKGEDTLQKYGLKPSQARNIDKQDLKRIKSIGWADELAPNIRKGDTSVLKAMIRDLERQYPKSWAGSMLRDDEVMSKIIAQRMFGWDQSTFEAQVKDTKWWRTTEPYQREFLTSQSPKQQKNSINRTLEQVINQLEDVYGMDWVKYVDGGMKQARTWATKIASGIWGEPGSGFEYWAEKMFDRASAIENTPAWVQNQQEQEELRAFANRPDEMFERLRSESMSYLGQMNGQPLLDKSTLKDWANRLVTQRADEGDWAQFLRQQMKSLHPYFDENVAFTQQASPYKSVYESIMGTTTDWDNKMLRSFQGFDENGKPTGTPMSLHDFEMTLRDYDKNPGAWQRGTKLYDEGTDFAAKLMNTFRGVTF